MALRIGQGAVRRGRSSPQPDVTGSAGPRALHLVRDFPRVELRPAMTPRQRATYWGFVGTTAVTNLFFWGWWLTAGNIGNPVLFGLRTVTTFYITTLLPGMYMLFLGYMKRPKHIRAPRHARVAVISLTVPGSESLEIVEEQLRAMRAIHYKHDSWLLVDKCHSPEIEALCEKWGVKYFSRHHQARWGHVRVKLADGREGSLIEYWNQPGPPFKAKTKAGNVNAWLDMILRTGAEDYAFFTQFDIDHLARPRYLHKVLGYFSDPKVAWVQAPSVYDNWEYWTALGSTEQELVLQGILQMGFFGFSRTPFIIGSHCTYRMSAIREIGGFQPTRAEDHLDTLCLAGRGYEGVFLPEIIAVGDGPETFETYLAQQFAWAYSMFQVFQTHTPRLLKNRQLNLRQSLQFLFAQTWYPFWSCSMLTMFLLPVGALAINAPVAHVDFWIYLAHYLPLSAVNLVTWFWSRKWFQPREGALLSWRGIILHIARWPVVLSALLQAILNVQKPYMITRKGVIQGEEEPFLLAPHIPYFILIAGSLGAVWYYLLHIGRSAAQGDLLFAIQGALMVFLVFVAALWMDIKDLYAKGLRLGRCLSLRLLPLLVSATIVVATAITVWACAGRIREALTYGAGRMDYSNLLLRIWPYR